MEPIPETVEAIQLLSGRTAAPHLLGDLRQLGQTVRDVVPDCVGLSFTYLDPDVTLTLVASSKEFAILDALQELSGPADDEPEPRLGQADPLDEETWRLYARGTAARGVLSTLSMPVRLGDRFVGRINLYGGSANAFTGHHDELASRLGTWAPGAVVNTDLEFQTRSDAARAPTRLRSEGDT